MYEYVESGEVKRYRSCCSKIMEEVHTAGDLRDDPSEAEG